MFRISICICWQIENKNMSRIGVRHCLKWFMSRLKNIQATRKRIKILWSSTDQKMKLDRLNIAEKEFLQNFKIGPSPWKCLGFQLNTPKYKRKTLATFWRFSWKTYELLLWDLKHSVPSNPKSVYQNKIHNQVLVESSCC